MFCDGDLGRFQRSLLGILSFSSTLPVRVWALLPNLCHIVAHPENNIFTLVNEEALESPGPSQPPQGPRH